MADELTYAAIISNIEYLTTQRQSLAQELIFVEYALSIEQQKAIDYANCEEAKAVQIEGNSCQQDNKERVC